MSTNTDTQNTPTPTEADSPNYLNPITLIGGILGEAYEQVSNIGNAILDAPADFGRGFENNLFTDRTPAVPTEDIPVPTENVVTQQIAPTDAQIDEEIERLRTMKSTS